VRGPRTDWFDRESSAALTSARWTATGALDRIGVRLDGPPIRRATAYEGKELPSEPMVRGSIQVPPDGQPVVLLADHPTTGGYPVIAVVTDADTDRVAQLRPGDPVRFRAVPPPWR
jgi:allophanate hydrolase subunit 2